MAINQVYTNALLCAPTELRRIFRSYEDVSKKIINSKWSKTFNIVCLKENIVPHYVCNKKIDPAICNSQDNISYQRSIIEKEVEDQAKKLEYLNEKKENIYSELLNSTLDDDVRQDIFNSLEADLDNSERAKKLGIIKKLNRLYNGKKNFFKENLLKIIFRRKFDLFLKIGRILSLYKENSA